MSGNVQQTADSRSFPFLLILFAGSGFSALIYEIVWYQLLQLVIGLSTVSLGVLLATFMWGLCVGSMASPRILEMRRLHPLRAFTLIELGIGFSGILVVYGMPFVNGLHVAVLGHGLPAILLRAMISAICLLVPTILMGASLPTIAWWVGATPRCGIEFGG